jgi:hypothetical protein
MVGLRWHYSVSVEGKTPDDNRPDGLSGVHGVTLPPATRIYAVAVVVRAEFNPAKRRATYQQLQRVATEVGVLKALLCWRGHDYSMKRHVRGVHQSAPGIQFVFRVCAGGDHRTLAHRCFTLPDR